MNKLNRKNFIWNAIGLTAYSFLSLFLLIVVNRINGFKDAGMFTYSYSICILFFYASLYYNRTFQISNNNFGYTFNQFLTTRILTSLISFFALLLFCFISNFNFEKTLLIIILMLSRSFEAISDTIYGYFQAKDKLYLVGISYFLKSFFGLILFIIIDYIFKNIYLSSLFLLIVNCFFFIFFDLINYKKEKQENIKLDFSLNKKLLKTSFSLFIFQFIAIYLSNCQKYVITYFSSNEMQTIFGILIMPSTILSLVGNYLIHPFINKLNRYKNNCEYKKFNKLLIIILEILFVFGAICIFVSNLLGIPFLNLVYGLDLEKYKLDLLIVIFASIFNSGAMILSSLLTILNKNNIQVFIYSIAAFVATISCYLLIKNSVVRGAVLSYLIACFALFILYLIIYLKILKKTTN